MNKYHHYAFLAESHAQDVVKDTGSWTDMLDLVARLYKYPFPEQLLIHAQKPDATACASIPVWNKSMNRSVKKGTKGIALLDNTDGKQRLIPFSNKLFAHPLSIGNATDCIIAERIYSETDVVNQFINGME